MGWGCEPTFHLYRSSDQTSFDKNWKLWRIRKMRKMLRSNSTEPILGSVTFSWMTLSPFPFSQEALVRLLKGESQFWLLTSLLTAVVALDTGLKYNLEVKKRKKPELKYPAPLWKTKFNQKSAATTFRRWSVNDNLTRTMLIIGATGE